MTIRNRLRHALPAGALVLALLVGLFTLPAAAANTASDVTFTFTDSGVTVSDDSAEGYKISGTDLTISAAGAYTVTGSCAQAAAILMRYAAYKGLDTAARAALSFPDAGDVPDWAHDAMQWCVAKGLLQGSDTGALLPNGTATRAQIATIMTRYLAA